MINGTSPSHIQLILLGVNKEEKVAGLITLEDILEELVGSIQDEHDLSD